MISIIIENIIKSYFTLLFSISCGALFVFLLGLYWIFRKKPANKTVFLQEKPAAQKILSEKTISMSEIVKDLSAISGEDTLATQLDLARAYIETGKISLAKKILESVKQHGNQIQQKEALALLKVL